MMTLDCTFTQLTTTTTSATSPKTLFSIFNNISRCTPVENHCFKASPLANIYQQNILEDYDYKNDHTNRSLFWGIKSYFKILNVKKVNNPQLYGMYLLWKEELKVSDSNQLKERQLYHATSPKNALSISQNDIDWRKTYRSRFGIGACFSPCPKYAHRHSSANGAFMICKVLTKKIEVVDVNYDLIVPTKRENDTSLGNTGKVYVKYDDYTYYPEFIVYYVY